MVNIEEIEDFEFLELKEAIKQLKVNGLFHLLSYTRPGSIKFYNLVQQQFPENEIKLYGNFHPHYGDYYSLYNSQLFSYEEAKATIDKLIEERMLKSNDYL